MSVIRLLREIPTKDINNGNLKGARVVVDRMIKEILEEEGENPDDYNFSADYSEKGICKLQASKKYTKRGLIGDSLEKNAKEMILRMMLESGLTPKFPNSDLCLQVAELIAPMISDLQVEIQALGVYKAIVEDTREAIERTLLISKGEWDFSNDY